MANQAQSIVSHEKAVNPVVENRSPIDQEVFGELTERALCYSITEEMLFSSLAEYLAAKGIGFAVARITEEATSLELEALFAPNGTNHTPCAYSCPSKSDSFGKIRLITNLTEDLGKQEVLFMSAADEIVEDGGEVLRQAFGTDPMMIISLQRNQPLKEILILSGNGLDDKWMSKAMDLAGKLSSALEIIRLQSDLCQREGHHDWLYRYSKEGHLLTDAQGVIRGVNQKAMELLSLPREDLVCKNIVDIIPRSKDLMDHSQVSTQVSPSVIEVDYQVQGESVRYLHVEHHPVTMDEESEVLVKISDLTDRWRYEDMARQLVKLNTVGDKDLSVGMLLQDSYGNILQVNESAVEMLGYSLESLRGQPWTMIIPEDQQYKVNQANLRRMRGESGRYEIQLLHKNGKRLDMLVSESPYHENGCYAGTFVFITDLTTLRKAEAIVLGQNWELQRVIERFVRLNQKAMHSLHMVEPHELLEQVGEELHQLGMTCLIATFNPNEPYWNIQYGSSHLGRMNSEGIHPVSDFETSIAVDFKDPSLILLQSGETIFVEEPDRTVESLVSQVSPFNPFLEGVTTCPRILAPLKTIDRLLGVLVICGEELTSEELPTITTFANHLSIALEKSRLITNTMVQARLGKVLAEIVSATRREKDLTHLAKVSGQLILEALKLQLCTFSFVGDSGDTLSVLLSIVGSNCINESPIPAAGCTIKLMDFPIVEGVLRTGRQAILSDSRPLFIDEGRKFSQVNTCPSLLIPMTASEKNIGLVSLLMDDPDRKLSPDEQLFLQTSVDQISAAVVKVQQLAEEDHKAQIEQTLSGLIVDILASRDLEEVVQLTLKGVAPLFPCHFVCLTRFDLLGRTAQILGVLGQDKKPFEVGEIIPLEEWDGNADLIAGKVVHYEASHVMDSASEVARRVFGLGSKSWLSLPLIVQNEIFGALSIASGQANISTPENLALASRIQDRLAIALSNAYNHTNMSRQAKEMTALVDLALAIADEQELRSLLHTALQRSTQILDATMGAIFLIEKTTDEMTLVTELGLPLPPAVLRLQKGQGLAGKVWEKRDAFILEKLRDLGDPGWLEACYATGSAIGVPLLWEDEVRGVLALYQPGEGKRFTQHDAEVLSQVAAQVSVRMIHIQEYEKTTRKVNQLRVVNDVARRMSTILVEDLLFTEIVRRAAHGLNLDLVMLFLVERDELIEVASYYLPEDMYGIWEPITLKIGRGGVIGWVASEGQPVLISDVSSDPNYLPIIPIDIKIQSVVGIPLKLKGEITGVFLAGSEKLAAFDKVDVDALLALGAHISTSIENARSYEETKVVQYRLAESEKLRSIGLVTGGIAHDFNNLLSVILSRTELALMHTDDEEVRRHLEQVIASAKEGGETIHRLEGFVTTEKDKSDFTGVDINQVVKEAIEISKPRWKDRAKSEGIEIQMITELYTDQPILGRPSELREVLVNLIFNALEAIPAGGIIVLKTDNKDNGISLIVSDDGVGMTPDMKNQIFVPFFTTKPGRVGLGLSMCYGILQRHGGTIDIQSEIGEGTTVSIWLPTYAKIGSEDDFTQSTTIPALVEPVTILIVEDEKSILEGLVETFADAGHKVLAASNGLEGFELFLEAGRLDIVFTELGMPKLSGWELIEQLRAFDSKLPIVIFSGWGDVINPMKLRQFGIAKVIKKPFEMAKLHSTLYEVLAMRKRLDPS